jgi:hypothetical protein
MTANTGYNMYCLSSAIYIRPLCHRNRNTTSGTNAPSNQVNMDLTTAQLAKIERKIVDVEAARAVETSEAMKMAYTREIASLHNRAAGLESHSAALIPDGMIWFF